jgi:hypothetical protein
MEYCLTDARAKGKSGVCMLGATKQKSWLSDQSFAKKFGFGAVDTTDYGYELLALSFDGTTPKFTQNVKSPKIESNELTIYYDLQCPYISQNIGMISSSIVIRTVSPHPLFRWTRWKKQKRCPVFSTTGPCS